MRIRRGPATVIGERFPTGHCPATGGKAGTSIDPRARRLTRSPPRRTTGADLPGERDGTACPRRRPDERRTTDDGRREDRSGGRPRAVPRRRVPRLLLRQPRSDRSRPRGPDGTSARSGAGAGVRLPRRLRTRRRHRRPALRGGQGRRRPARLARTGQRPGRDRGHRRLGTRGRTGRGTFAGRPRPVRHHAATTAYGPLTVRTESRKETGTVHEARASTASVTAALHDVAGLGDFFAPRAGGRDDCRPPVARSCAVGFTDLAESRRTPPPHYGAARRRLHRPARSRREVPRTRKRRRRVPPAGPVARVRYRPPPCRTPLTRERGSLVNMGTDRRPVRVV